MSYPSLLYLICQFWVPLIGLANKFTKADLLWCRALNPDMRILQGGPSGGSSSVGPQLKHELSMSLLTFVYHVVGNDHNYDESYVLAKVLTKYKLQPPHMMCNSQILVWRYYLYSQTFDVSNKQIETYSLNGGEQLLHFCSLIGMVSAMAVSLLKRGLLFHQIS